MPFRYYWQKQLLTKQKKIMMLEDAKIHLSEMLKIIKEIQANPELATKSLNQDYLKTLNEFEQRFKLWNPNVYVYVEGGTVQGASADCNMFFNLFDDDNEKAVNQEELEPGDEPYEEKKNMWQWMIDSGHRDGSLKAIF